MFFVPPPKKKGGSRLYIFLVYFINVHILVKKHMIRNFLYSGWNHSLVHRLMREGKNTLEKNMEFHILKGLFTNSA